jgi:MHS family alpha-ketoglutarate permease-like MFS transporter
VASTVGNVLEWYEWSAYAVFTPFIAAVMFHQGDPFSALLSTLAVFAVGFLMRPLGGIVFGRIADRRGRKFVLVTTMLLMAAGSLVIAIFGGSVLAYGFGGVLTEVLTDSALAEWGWRVPFLLGALLALAALYLRRGMDESDVFEADQRQEKRAKEAKEKEADPEPRTSRVQLTKAILLMIAMTSGITAAHYVWTSYVSTYAITQQGMDLGTAYWMLVIAQAIALVSLPFWGLFSDRVGRRPVLLIFAVLMFALQYPLTQMITDQWWTLLVATTTALLLVSAPAASLSAILSENFPTRVRTQGIGFAYSLSVAVFGGTAPYLNQLFINTGIGWVFGGYIMLLCCLTGLACLFIRETKGPELTET